MRLMGRTPHSKQTEVAPSPRRVGIIAAVLVAMCLVAYGPFLTNYFVDDDLEVIFNPRYWYYPLSGSRIRPVLGALTEAHYRLLGLQPVGYHLTSLVAHTGTTLAVFALGAGQTRNLLTGAAMAAAYALYPRHHEAVLRTSNLNIPFASLFGVLAVWLYLVYRERGGRWIVGGSLLSFALALLSYEPAVALLPILVAGEIWVVRGQSGGPRKILWAYGVLTVLYLVLSFSGKGMARLSTEAADYHFMGIGSYSARSFASYLAYLFFPWVTMGVLKRDLYGVVLAMAAVLLLASLMIFRNPVVRYGAFWIGAAIVPYVFFASFGPKDQYLHFAAIGLMMAAGAIGLEVWKRLQGHGTARAALLACLVAYLAFGMGRIWYYGEGWRRAGLVVDQIGREVAAIRPVPPKGSMVYVLGVPRHNDRVTILNNGIGALLRLTFNDRALGVAYSFDGDLAASIARSAAPATPDAKPGIYLFTWTGRLEDHSDAFPAIEGTLSGTSWIFTAAGW